LQCAHQVQWDRMELGGICSCISSQGWGVPQHNIAGLCLSPDMMPETGIVEVEIRANNETLCTHRALWTTGQIYSIYFFPRLVHTSTVNITFTQLPSWIALLWAEAWLFRDRPTMIKSPRSLSTHASLLQRHTISQTTEPNKKYFVFINTPWHHHHSHNP
jgi:hypothetical protein